MKGTRAALRYAKATLNLARDKNQAETVNDDMRLVMHTFAHNKSILLLLKIPVVKAEIKKAALKEIFANVSPITNGLIDLLIENKRIALLSLIAEKYSILYEQLRGKEVAVVTTAVPLTDALTTKVLAKIRELTPNHITIENKIDESIIGGFILRIGDLQYNASIANKLSSLKREFNNKLYISQL